MIFNEFKKELKGIKYHSEKDWEILLPYDTKIEVLQTIIDKCKENMLLDWHRTHSEVEGEDIRFYWDRKNLTSTE